jgi:predicted DNA-binding transcriptional regulator AlpA
MNHGTESGATSAAGVSARVHVSCAHPSDPHRQRVSGTNVTAMSPWPRLLDINRAAEYLGLSRWSLYDLVRSGLIPLVKMPSVRVDLGPRKTGNPKSRRRVLARPDFRQPLRKILLDRRDLDQFIDGLPHEKDGRA